jgi:PAS domain S-box-containing protein
MNIGELNKTQEALRESEERFRALVKASSDVLYRMSPDWSEMLNIKGMDFIADVERPNRDWLSIYIPLDEQPRAWAAIQEAIRRKSIFELEHQVMQADGTVGWVSSRAVPLLDSHREIIEWIVAASDITDRKLAEEALRRREEKLAWTQQVGGVASLEINVSNGLSGRRSREYLWLHGLTAASSNETHEDWLKRVHPDDRDRAQKKLHAALASPGSKYENVYRIIRPNDGEERWIYATANIERNAQGEPVQLIGAHIDITERKRAEVVESAGEAQHAFLLELSDELRDVSDPHDIKELSAMVLGQYLNLSGVGYVEVGPDGDAIFSGGEYRDGRLPPNNGWYRLSDFGDSFGPALHAGEEIFSNDITADTRGSAGGSATTHDFQLRAAAALPLIKKGCLVAYLYAIHHEPRIWNVRERQLMREVADRTWSAVERARAEAALRESGEKFRKLFESMDEGYILVDVIFDGDGRPVDIRFLDANPAAVKMTGTELVGKTMRELDPEFESHWFETFGRVARSGIGERCELSAAPLDVFYSCYIFKVGGPDDMRVAAVYQDITGRKRREANTLFLVELMADIGVQKTAEEIARSVCDKIASHLKLSKCVPVEIDEAAGRAIILYDEKAGNMPSLVGEYRIADYLTGDEVRDLSAGRAIVIDDVADEPRTAEVAARFARLQIRAMANASCLSNGQCKFVLSAMHTLPRVWRADEIEILQAVSVRLWLRMERARVEQDLRESEEKFRILSNTAPALIWFDDPDGNCLKVNQVYLNFYGKTAEEVMGTGWHLILHEDDADAYISAFQRAVSGRRPFHHLVRAKRYDGEWRWLESFAQPLLASDGTFLGYVGVSPDITDRVRAEQAWRKSEERLRLMVESVEDYAIFTMNNEGLIETWNIGAERVFGYREDEIIGQHGKMLYTPEDRLRDVPAKEMLTARAEGSAEDERWHIRKDGTRFYASGVLTSFREGNVETGYVKIARDLTEQKRAAEELRRAHAELEEKVHDRTSELATANELLRGEISERIQTEKDRVRLLRQIVRAQEDERRRIARDIHDHFGQQLTALRLNLEILHQVCRENEEACLKLEQTKVIAERLDADVDFLAWELRPVALDDIGLVEALNDYVREWSKHSGVKAEFHTTGVEQERLAPETETNLYRITQEALNNTMKYARATHVAVMLERRGHQILLIVEDNGIGFNLRKEVSGGRDKRMGLIGMRERAVLIGGTLEIESKPKEGTTIFARVPVEFPKKGGTSG